MSHQERTGVSTDEAHGRGKRPDAAPADATYVNKRTPADDAEEHHMRARKAVYGDRGINDNPTTQSRADKEWNETNRFASRLLKTNIKGEIPDSTSDRIDRNFDALAKTSTKAVETRKKFPKQGRTGPG